MNKFFVYFFISLLSIIFFFSPKLLAEIDNNSPGQASFSLSSHVINVESGGHLKSIKIKMTMPKGFHAYADQFKIVDINPSTFKIGQLKLSPEVKFFDKHNNKEKSGLYENGEIELQLETPEKTQSNDRKLTFNLKYQICSEKVCYLPKIENFEINLNYTRLEEKTESIMQTSFFSAGTIENQLSKNFVLTYFLVFLAGILTSFTPCIFPMIPITLSILGHNSHKNSRVQNISRSIFYVFGIAVTYSSLGVIAALTGSIFGQALANKYVILGMVTLFVLMAFSMWGAFELQVPAFVRNRFGTGTSKGYFGAFLMGLVAGIVASPCVGPVLVSILSFVSTTQNVAMGFTLLFTYAVGLGLIFIAIGASGQVMKKLPKSGPWMEFIKFSLGLLMILVALYYLKLVIPMQYWLTTVGLTFSALSIWQGAFNFKRKHPFRQGLFIAVFILSFTLTLLSLLKMEYVTPVFTHAPENITENPIQWIPYSEDILNDAIKEQQPVMLDFFAEWCAACHELEDKTYTHPEFVKLSKQFKLVKVDATEDTPEVQAILKKYKIQGLPTVLFINKKGEILSDLTFTQFLQWNDLNPKMLKALE